MKKATIVRSSHLWKYFGRAVVGKDERCLVLTHHPTGNGCYWVYGELVELIIGGGNPLLQRKWESGMSLSLFCCIMSGRVLLCFLLLPFHCAGACPSSTLHVMAEAFLFWQRVILCYWVVGRLGRIYLASIWSRFYGETRHDLVLVGLPLGFSGPRALVLQIVGNCWCEHNVSGYGAFYGLRCRSLDENIRYVLEETCLRM